MPCITAHQTQETPTPIRPRAHQRRKRPTELRPRSQRRTSMTHRTTATSGHHTPSVNPRKWNGGGYKYLCQTGTVIG
jgi:hypothetical protein